MQYICFRGTGELIRVRKEYNYEIYDEDTGKRFIETGGMLEIYNEVGLICRYANVQIVKGSICFNDIQPSFLTPYFDIIDIDGNLNCNSIDNNGIVIQNSKLSGDNGLLNIMGYAIPYSYAYNISTRSGIFFLIFGSVSFRYIKDYTKSMNVSLWDLKLIEDKLMFSLQFEYYNSFGSSLSLVVDRPKLILYLKSGKLHSESDKLTICNAKEYSNYIAEHIFCDVNNILYL